MSMCRQVIVLALCKLSLIVSQGDGEQPGDGNAAVQEMDACACELPIRTEYERLCSPDINFLTHLQLAGDGNPRCHNPVNVGPASDKCMSVVYTFESTKVGGVTIDISTPRDVPGCEIVPQEGVKYAISGKQFRKDVVTCNENNAGDFVFIVDESTSVGESRFQNIIKPFLNDLKNAVIPATGPLLSNFATLTFASFGRVQFGLQTGRSSAEISSLINALTYSSRSKRAIGTALSLAANSVLRPPFDSDPNPNICIVLSDGNSNTALDLATGAALLKAKCPTIFAIGIGNSIDDETLETIASDPDKAIRVSNFSGLSQTLVETIKRHICTPTGETKKVCYVEHCSGIFKNSTHDDFHALKQTYESCRIA